jgi:hypothetical protein
MLPLLSQQQKAQLTCNFGSMDNLEPAEPTLFYGDNPNMIEALILAGEERRVWIMTGAVGCHFLWPLLRG